MLFVLIILSDMMVKIIINNSVIYNFIIKRFYGGYVWGTFLLTGIGIDVYLQLICLLFIYFWSIFIAKFKFLKSKL